MYFVQLAEAFLTCPISSWSMVHGTSAQLGRYHRRAPDSRYQRDYPRRPRINLIPRLPANRRATRDDWKQLQS